MTFLSLFTPNKAESDSVGPRQSKGPPDIQYVDVRQGPESGLVDFGTGLAPETVTPRWGAEVPKRMLS